MLYCPNAVINAVFDILLTLGINIALISKFFSPYKYIFFWGPVRGQRKERNTT